MIVKCECGRIGALLHERTDPRTFKPIRVRLCKTCATRGGYVRVLFHRAPAMSALGMRWH